MFLFLFSRAFCWHNPPIFGDIGNGFDYLTGKKALHTRDWVNIGIIVTACVIAPYFPAIMSYEMIGYIAGGAAIGAAFQDGPFFQNFMNNWASGIVITATLNYTGITAAIFGPSQSMSWEAEVLVSGAPTAVRATPPFNYIEVKLQSNNDLQTAVIIGIMLIPLFL